MATLTGLTAARMLAVEAASVVAGTIVGPNLILQRKDTSTFNAGQVTPSVVSSLPGSPTDGQEVYYQNAAMATAGIMWHLRYRAAATTYKWEVLGGGPFMEHASAATTRAVSTYGDLTSGAMSTWTIPLVGEYEVEIGASLSPGAAGQGFYMSIAIAGATALDADSVLAYCVSSLGQWDVSRKMKKVFAATDTVVPKFKQQGATAGNVTNRYICIKPIRVN